MHNKVETAFRSFVWENAKAEYKARHVLFVGVHKHFAGASWVELRSSITFIMMYLLYCCVADIMSVQLSCIEARTRTLTDFPGNSSLAIRLMPRLFGTNAHGSLPTRMCQGVCSIPSQDYSVRVGLRLLIFEARFNSNTTTIQITCTIDIRWASDWPNQFASLPHEGRSAQSTALTAVYFCPRAFLSAIWTSY
jgi:hypothetical protein